MIFLTLYVDDILLIENYVGVISIVEIWLANYIDTKHMGEVNCILGIKLLRDRRNKILDLSQASCIDKILVKFAMHNSKTWLLTFRHGITLSKK